MATYVDSNLNDPSLFFEAVTYTGNTSSGTTNNDLSFQPNMVWFKSRTQAENHQIYDSVRGATKRLVVNGNQAEATASTGLTSFDSDGFTTGGENETDSGNIVAWCWKESATAGFDIVLYTGNGSNRTIAHGLSAKPDMIIAKSRSNVLNWKVGHEGLAGAGAGWTNYINMDESNAKGTHSTTWQDTAPTSSVWSLGTSNLNTDTYTYVAYLFAPKQGFSKFSSFVGSGSSDGPFCFCGFKPAWLMIKRSSDGTNSWEIRDNKRDSFNTADDRLFADLSNAEDSDNEGIDFLSNGFKIRNTGAGCNASGVTYIYMAFAEAPFVNSNGVPCNAR